MKQQISLTGRDFVALSRIAKRILLRATGQDAPFVAIPIPGQLPFVLRGDMVRSCVTGLELAKVAFTNKDDGIRLAIAGVRNGGKVRSSYTFYGLRREWSTVESIRKQTYTWAKNRRQRIQLKRMGVTGVRRSKVHKFLQEIERLEHRLVDTRTYKSIGTRLHYVPRNPIVTAVTQQHSEDKYRRWDAASVKTWRDGKAARKQLAKIAAKYIEQERQMFGKVKWAALYHDLAAAGFTITYQYGRQAGWVGGLNEAGYLRALPKFVGLSISNPNRLHRPLLDVNEQAQEHISELRVYACAMREAANIRAQIVTLKNMVATLQKQTSLLTV